jgi:sigma-B regulation protein RsbU (phosphoserine phosphatase)
VTLFLKQSGHVGGDLVGMFPAGDGTLGLFSIDVSGHGISSALMTARLAGYLSATSPEQNIALTVDENGSFQPRSPMAVVEDLNELILGEMETEHYFTLILAFVDLSSGHVRMSQAGHPHPAVQRKSGQVTVDGPGGFPVGLVPGAQFSEFEVSLDPGDRLLLLSDGVVECPAPTQEMLGEEGLAECLHDLRNVEGPAFFESLIWKLSEFAGDQGFPDDISGILFEYSGPSK